MEIDNDSKECAERETAAVRFSQNRVQTAAAALAGRQPAISREAVSYTHLAVRDAPPLPKITTFFPDREIPARQAI